MGLRASGFWSFVGFVTSMWATLANRITWRATDNRRASCGQALLSLLIVMLVATTSAFTLIWFMNQTQTRAGGRYRSAAALHVAEAGVQRAIGILETVTPDGRVSGRAWRPQGFTESVRVGPLTGQFAIFLDEDDGGARTIISVGEIGGVSRKIRVRVYLASPSLLAALYGAGIVKIDGPPAATFLLPYGEAVGNALRTQPWIHLMAGRAVWLAASNILINNSAIPFALSPGPSEPMAGQMARDKLRGAPIRVVLAEDAILAVGQSYQAVDISQLKAFGVPVQDLMRASIDWFYVPVVNRGYFLSLAAANKQNGVLNDTAGRYFADETLQRKETSVYDGAEFANLQAYLVIAGNRQCLRGVIYVRGSVTLKEGLRTCIEEGALVTEGAVRLERSAELSIKHSPVTRTLPGLVVLDYDRLILAEQSHLQVHGLVYVNQATELDEGAMFDVVGAVLGNDPALSFRATAATVLIRYDSAVLGTPGLIIADTFPAVAWIAAWEELP